MPVTYLTAVSVLTHLILRTTLQGDTVPQFYSWGDQSLDGAGGYFLTFLESNWEAEGGAQAGWFESTLLTTEINRLNLLFLKSLLEKRPFKNRHKCKQIKQTRPWFFIKRLLNVTVTDDWRRHWHPTPVLLPGKSHGRRSLVGCSPWGCEESDTTEQFHFHFSLSCIGEGNGNPLQCSCLENPRDGGAWWAAVYGITQSQTRLKWLSSDWWQKQPLGSSLLTTIKVIILQTPNQACLLTFSTCSLFAQCDPQCFTDVSFTPQNQPMREMGSHFSAEETEAPVDDITCARTRG